MFWPARPGGLREDGLEHRHAHMDKAGLLQVEHVGRDLLALWRFLVTSAQLPEKMKWMATVAGSISALNPI
jgi:RNAse (barnase) inhibitor barstar